jgi:hypothetical protein
MARGLPRGGPPSRFGRVSGTARRMWPVALEAWRRWDNLTPQQKERYRRMAGEYARRGRETLANRRGRRGGRYGR